MSKQPCIVQWRRVCGVVALAAVCAFAAAPPTTHPNAEKYQNLGAQPATGRSGNASLMARALLAKDKSTLVEVSTGALDTAATPPGQLSKVQLKGFDPNQNVLFSDNANHLSGGGYWSQTRRDLMHNQPLQVQSNIAGIDPRNDVVTVQTAVKLRPDLALASLSAPARAYVNTPVPITAVVHELNGDVGAHADCVLAVDGQPVDQAIGIWVDAADAVSCAFAHRFTSLGTHTLTVTAANVVPGDWDLANNSKSATIEIVEPIVQLHGWAFFNDYQLSGSGANANWSGYRAVSISVHSQQTFLYGYANVPSSASGHVDVTETGNDSLSAGTDLPPSYAYDYGGNTYRWSGAYLPGINAGVWSSSFRSDSDGSGSTNVYYDRYATRVVYHSYGYNNYGWYWWYYGGGYGGSYDYSYAYQFGTFIQPGSQLHVALKFVSSDGVTFVANPTIPIQSSTNYGSYWDCDYNYYYYGGTCAQVNYTQQWTSGGTSF